MLFTDHDFRTLIWNYYCLFYKESDEIKKFACSDGFISDFKRRHKFASRRQHFKRRPGTNPAEIESWKVHVSQLLKEKNNDFVLNCDETSWRLFPNGILTWADKGSDNVVCHVEGDEKGCLTVLATVSANGRELPLFFIAEGSTGRVEESQIGDVFYHWKTHTINGWMTVEAMCLYLMHIREECGDNEVNLLLDLHTTHRTDAVLILAKELNIHLHFIPGGCTDLLQPCDRRVFGSLKSTARALWRERVSRDPEAKRRKKDAVEDKGLGKARPHDD